MGPEEHLHRQDFRDEGYAARPEWVDDGLPERNCGRGGGLEI
jgi:hypothetical protein